MLCRYDGILVRKKRLRKRPIKKIKKKTDNLIKIELLDNSQISNDRNTALPYPKRIDSGEYDIHQYQARQKS